MDDRQVPVVGARRPHVASTLHLLAREPQIAERGKRNTMIEASLRLAVPIIGRSGYFHRLVERRDSAFDVSRAHRHVAEADRHRPLQWKRRMLPKKLTCPAEQLPRFGEPKVTERHEPEPLQNLTPNHGVGLAERLERGLEALPGGVGLDRRERDARQAQDIGAQFGSRFRSRGDGCFEKLAGPFHPPVSRVQLARQRPHERG